MRISSMVAISLSSSKCFGDRITLSIADRHLALCAMSFDKDRGAGAVVSIDAVDRFPLDMSANLPNPGFFGRGFFCCLR
jgi:hypothetical protein